MKYINIYSFLGFVACTLMILSYDADLRINFAGLLVHPYLIFMLLSATFFGSQLFNIDKRLLTAILLFGIVFGFPSLKNQNPFEEILKVGAAFFTFLFIYQTVKNEKDFRIISFALILVSLFISFRILILSGDAENRLAGINALESLGNKNAQSLFVLPGFYFVIYYLMQSRKLSWLTLWLSLGGIIVLAAALSANRSGWLGIIFVCIFGIGHSIRYFKPNFILLLILLGVGSYFLIQSFAEDVVQRKVSVTREGYLSDYGRRLLIQNSLAVGLENPIIGIGKDNLHSEMAFRLNVRREQVDTHNLAGYILGSSGLISFFFFMAIFYLMLKQNFKIRNQYWEILLWFIGLFFLRSLFSREILYSPTFFAGLGLLYARFRLEEQKLVSQIAKSLSL